MFEQFIQNGLYLKGWSPRTPAVYRRAYASFQAAVGEELTKTQLEAWVIWMRQRGLSPAGINIYIRSMNSYLSWLREEGHLDKPLKLKQVKCHPKPIQVFSEAEIKTLLAHKPKRLTYLRTWMIITLALDTGCRIDELLKLRKESIDFDNLLITVLGKGSKTRIVPFSAEMRKHLWKYCQRTGDIVFGTRNGTFMTHRNADRGMKACFKELGITGKHVHFHNLRHTFACKYIRQNGNIFTLSRLLGHSSVSTTQTYLRGLQVQDLKHYSGAF